MSSRPCDVALCDVATLGVSVLPTAPTDGVSCVFPGVSAATGPAFVVIKSGKPCWLASDSGAFSPAPGRPALISTIPAETASVGSPTKEGTTGAHEVTFAGSGGGAASGFAPSPNAAH